MATKASMGVTAFAIFVAIKVLIDVLIDVTCLIILNIAIDIFV